jgi:hypothetical protein
MRYSLHTFDRVLRRHLNALDKNSVSTGWKGYNRRVIMPTKMVITNLEKVVGSYYLVQVLYSTRLA